MLGLLVVILISAGCGVQPQPFANGSAQTAGSLTVTLTLQPNPPRAGRPAELTLTLHQQNQQPAPAGASVQLLADMPKMPMSLPDIPLHSMGNGQWQGHYTFPMAGGWAATVRVTPPQGAAADAVFSFDVGP